MPFIGFILIAMGLFAVGGTLYMVVNEHMETEEWYIPPPPAAATAVPPAVVAPPTTSAVSTPLPAVPPATSSPDVVSADPPAKTE